MPRGFVRMQAVGKCSTTAGPLGQIKEGNRQSYFVAATGEMGDAIYRADSVAEKSGFKSIFH